MERLQKLMAHAGVASRRHCEEIIRDGLVRVNGKVVTELPILVDAGKDTIVVSGRRLRLEKKVYYLLNKPRRVVCTNYDPEGRRRAIDLLKGVKERVYPVGRLDADTRGLLLLTNDGEFANQLTHPKYGIEKTYVAEIRGAIKEEDIGRLKKGIYLGHEGKGRFEAIRILRRGPTNTLLEITLKEGRNRQIRRMLARLGFPIRKLTRVRIGKLTLRGLGSGKFRALSTRQVNSLRKLVAQKQGKATRQKSGGKRKTAGL